MVANERVLVMAGGTGGHVFPALAVARKLRESGIGVSWLGAVGGIEEKLVPGQAIPLHLIQVSGLRGKGWMAQLGAPWRLARALWQANRVLSQVNPSVVLGFGGFVSGPGGVVAWVRRRRLIIHEQNAVAGTTNRLLRHLATQVLEAFPGSLPGARLVGNPVRESVEHLEAPELRLGMRTGPFRILVLGGSQGARFLNQSLPQALRRCQQAIEIRHQCGNRWLDETTQAYTAAGLAARVERFVEDMAEAYRWADLVICRSGAMTVAELAAAGVASILVPYPHAIDDHQHANAQWLVEAGAAEVMDEAEANAEVLASKIEGLLDRDGLMRMARAARQRAFPGAAAHIAALCRENL